MKVGEDLSVLIFHFLFQILILTLSRGSSYCGVGQGGPLGSGGGVQCCDGGQGGPSGLGGSGGEVCQLQGVPPLVQSSVLPGYGPALSPVRQRGGPC